MVLNDWLRGRIPFYTAPPEEELAKQAEEAAQISETAVAKVSRRRICMTAHECIVLTGRRYD